MLDKSARPGVMFLKIPVSLTYSVALVEGYHGVIRQFYTWLSAHRGKRTLNPLHRAGYFYGDLLVKPGLCFLNSLSLSPSLCFCIILDLKGPLKECCRQFAKRN